MKIIDRGLALLLFLGGGGHVLGSIESYRSEPKALLWAFCGSLLVCRAVWLREAPDEATATEKAAAEFKVPANRLTIRR